MVIREYCFDKWLGKCDKPCNQRCIDYRPVFLEDKLLERYIEQVREGDYLAQAIRENTIRSYKTVN